MTEPTAPEFMPLLSYGAHPDGPQDGGCLMEMASYLAGEQWSDQPKCVHPSLARAARVMNDLIGDEHRHLLLPLLPRLMGTGERSPEIEDALMEAEDAGPFGSTPSAQIAYLHRLVDAYDAVTGRTEVVEVTAEDYRRMAQLTGTP